MHLAMDPATSDIRAVEFTPSRDGDSPMLPDLLGQIPNAEQIGTVTALSHACKHAPAAQWMTRIPRPQQDRGAGCAACNPSATASPQETQTAEIHIRVALRNSFNALGTAEIVRMA